MNKPTPLHVSEAFNIEAEESLLDFFDANLAYDSLLFIDPFLLKRSPLDHERELFKRFSLFFKKAYEKSVSAKNDESQLFRLRTFLSFKEPKEINLGYSQYSNRGSGLGIDFAESLLTFFLKSTAARLVQEDELFPEEEFNPKFVSIFADKFAEDGISDLSANLIMDYLISYTQEQAKNWNIPTKILPVNQAFDFEEMNWTNGINAKLPENPHIPGQPIILIPKRLLRSHDISEKDKTIKRVIGILKRDPDTLHRFSNIVSRPIAEINIEEIRNILLTEDSILKEFIQSFEYEEIDGYNFNNDRLGFLSIKKYRHWFENIEVSGVTSCDDLLKETMSFIEIVRQEFEVRDLWKDVWNSTIPAQEPVFGRKFRAMGICFFDKFPSVSFMSQVGTGNGLLDFAVIFKDCRIAIEVKKLSNNSQTGTPSLPAYMHGLKRQLPNYAISMHASNAIYLTIQHYKGLRKKRNDDYRADEIRGATASVQEEIKDKLVSFDQLIYVNIDVSPKKSASQL